MKQNYGRDLTAGSIPKQLLYYSIPTLIGNLLQTAYSIINAIWIGNIVGENGIGATTVTTSVILVMISLAVGMTNATTILVSQFYGAKNFQKVKLAVNNSFSLALIMGSVLTVVSIAASDWILKVMGTPDIIFAQASSYLKISLLGFVMLFFSALILSILRGIGDSITPLIFTAVGVVLNAILDPIFIIGLGPIPRSGLNGAAFASLIAQGIAFLSSLYYLNRKNHVVALKFKNFVFNKEMTVDICKLGFPFAIQQVLVSLGGMFVNAMINSFGAAAVNAYGAAMRIDQLAYMPAQSLGISVSTLAGQNIGANKMDRVKEILKWGIIFTAIITAAISICTVSIPQAILSLFGFDRGSAGIEIGIQYLRIVGASYICLSVLLVVSGVFNGAGQSVVSMALALLSLWVVRLPLAYVLSKTFLGITGIWIAIDVSFFIVMSAGIIYYFSGRWKKAAERVAERAARLE
jgi:putative MATE family efflux protein